MTPSFVVFDGIDGSGKSTQIEMLADRLRRTSDVTPLILAEPSFGPHGKKLRRLAETDQLGDLAAQNDLFTLDRRDHVRRKIEPLLAFVRSHEGFMILQSRYYLSAPAYQAYAPEEESMAALLDEQTSFAPAPDLFVVLDVPVEVAMRRIEGRTTDAFERTEVLENVRRRFRMLGSILPNCVRLIDANAPAEEVADRVGDVLAKWQEQRS